MSATNDFCGIGEVISAPQFCHKTKFGDCFQFHVKVMRNSGKFDIFRCIVLHHLMDKVKVGNPIEIYGEIRTRNEWVNNKNKLKVYVWAKEIFNPAPEAVYTNRISLDGVICKPPILRDTPLGKRICDVLLAVNRPYGESDYIPCILWGKSAEIVSEKEVGARLVIRGRFQSREYEKDGQIMTAYEVSAEQFEGGV